MSRKELVENVVQPAIDFFDRRERVRQADPAALNQPEDFPRNLRLLANQVNETIAHLVHFSLQRAHLPNSRSLRLRKQ